LNTSVQGVRKHHRTLMCSCDVTEGLGVLTAEWPQASSMTPRRDVNEWAPSQFITHLGR